MSSMAASLANSANLGIPIAVYVLGDASYVAPLLIFQLAFFTPLFLMILDASTSTHRTTPAALCPDDPAEPDDCGLRAGPAGGRDWTGRFRPWSWSRST